MNYAQAAQAYIASDHAGVKLKAELFARLTSLYGDRVQDLGPENETSVDYPDYARPLALKVAETENAFGVLICGSGNGVCITANKTKGIRAGLAWNPEVAGLVRAHNNANVLCLPARYLSVEEALSCLTAFLETEFEGGRHANRVAKIEA